MKARVNRSVSMLWIIKMAIRCVLREGNDGPRSKFFMRTLTGAITALVMVAGFATPAIPQARTSEPSAAELPFARSRDGIRETYILSFGLFGPESVFASEAEKAAEILRARLQPDARLLVRFNHKRGGSATSATSPRRFEVRAKSWTPARTFWWSFSPRTAARTGSISLQAVAAKRFHPAHFGRC